VPLRCGEALAIRIDFNVAGSSDAERSRARATSSPAAPVTKGAAKLVPVAEGKTDDARDQLAALLADADATQEVRVAALRALLTVKDPRLDRALAAVVRDAGLEGSFLLERTEALLRERKIKLALV